MWIKFSFFFNYNTVDKGNFLLFIYPHLFFSSNTINQRKFDIIHISTAPTTITIL